MQPAATDTPKALQPLQLPCPLCTKPNAGIMVDLSDLGGAEFHCKHCGGDFSVALIRLFIAQWQPVLAWLALVPQPGDEE